MKLKTQRQNRIAKTSYTVYAAENGTHKLVAYTFGRTDLSTHYFHGANAAADCKAKVDELHANGRIR